MDALPLFAESAKLSLAGFFRIPGVHVLVFAQNDRPHGTVKLDHRFAILSDNMQVRWTVIVGMNHDPPAGEACNCRQL